MDVFYGMHPGFDYLVVGPEYVHLLETKSSSNIVETDEEAVDILS